MFLVIGWRIWWLVLVWVLGILGWCLVVRWWCWWFFGCFMNIGFLICWGLIGGFGDCFFFVMISFIIGIIVLGIRFGFFGWFMWIIIVVWCIICLWCFVSFGLVCWWVGFFGFLCFCWGFICFWFFWFNLLVCFISIGFIWSSLRLWVFFGWVFNMFFYYWVYYGVDVFYLDCNYGGILIVWDWFFGMFEFEV